MNNSLDQYIGSAFVWFTGVVEDIQDPLEIGRIRVRCFGFHSESRDEVPTESLPWASVITPITNAAISGTGQSATGVLPGAWVIGFFRDSMSAQDPVVLGTIPSISSTIPAESGFSDPQGIYPFLGGVPDIPIEATSKFAESSLFLKRKDLRHTNVECAIEPRCTTIDVSAPTDSIPRPTWSTHDLDTQVLPQYGSNSVIRTKSGHLLEIDDSDAANRLLKMHSSGTYEEIVASGDRTLTVVGDSFTVVFNSNNVYIAGNANVTIDGTARTLIKGNYHLEVEGDYTENIKGSKKTKIGGSELKEISNDYAENIGKNKIIHITQDETVIIDGSYDGTIGKNHELIVSENLDLKVVGNLKSYVGGKYNSMTIGDSKHTYNNNLAINTGGNSDYTTIGKYVNSIGSNCEFVVTSDLLFGVGGNNSTVIKGSENVEITGSQTIKASNTSILNNVSVTGTTSSSVDVIGGSDNISLIGHKHKYNPGSGLPTDSLPPTP